MAEHDRLQKEIEELQRRLDFLTEKISQLNEARDRETRVEEKIRLEGLIREDEAEQRRVEARLQVLENARSKEKLLADAQRLELNKPYAKALQTWDTIQTLDPTDSQANDEIQRLTNL